MANLFSADYWKALYFKAMGGQETAVDPNAMSGSWSSSSSWTGTLENGAPVVGGATEEFHGPRRTLGWIRDAAYSLLRGSRKREQEEAELAARIAEELATALPEAVDAETLERSIDERAKEIADRLISAVPAAPIGVVIPSGLPRPNTRPGALAAPYDIQGSLGAAAIEQAALQLELELKRKLDEEEALILLLLAA